MYTAEKRSELVRMHLNGVSLREIERRYGFDRKELADWVRKYQREGVEGILRKKKAMTTYELRCRIVAEHIEEDVPYQVLAAKYDVCRATLKKWVATVRQSGYETLTGSRRGRPLRKPEQS
jgi:transposase-like protein